MKQFLLSVILLIVTAAEINAFVEPSLEAMDLQPTIQVYHSYTYVVQEDGSAKVWLLIDNVQNREQGRTIRYTLPENSQGEALAWYRENGCMEYSQDSCINYGNTNWQLLDVVSDDRQLNIAVPQAKYPGRYGENSASVGIIFTIKQVTNPAWWGRKVNISTGTSDQYVANVNMGVYLPEGLYVRDRSQGPNNWAASLSESVNISKNRPSDFDAMKNGQAMMLNMAGSGQIYRHTYNLLPGATYSFSFMSSGSLWTLYYAEILLGILWLIAIAIVIAVLLRLIVGRKPLGWYMAIIGLLVLLSILLGGLWFTFYGTFGSRGGYPMPFMNATKDIDENIPSEGTIDSTPAEVMPVETIKTMETTQVIKDEV